MNWAVVVPTCRLENFKTFEQAWKPQFEAHNVELIVVEDSEKTWKQLPSFIPNRSGSIRSFGLLKAWKRGWDVLNLDDDVLPVEGVDLIQEYEDAFNQRWGVSEYLDIGHSFGLGEYMRGYPLGDRDVASPLLQYGGWHGTPDLDGITQSLYEARGKPVSGFHFDSRIIPVPKGAALSACIMNLACKAEAVCLLYQFVQGVDRVGYDRYDDLWSGLIAKRICDHLGVPLLVNGKAAVVHTRASNTAANLEKERGGYALNESMWRNLQTVELTARTPFDCYRQMLPQLVPEWFGARGRVLINGIVAWLNAAFLGDE